MFDKGKHEQRYEQEDAIFNKMLLWLVGVGVVELFLLLIRLIYVEFKAGPAAANVVNQFFHIFAFLGVALTAAAVVWAVLNYRRKKSALVPCICAAAAAGLWLLSVLGYWLYPEGISIMMFLPAPAAALVVVYFLYQRVFFVNTVVAAGGLLVLWIHHQYYEMHPTLIRLCFAAGFILVVLALVLAQLLRRGDGKLGGLQILPPDTDYLMTWSTCMVTAVALGLALVLGAAGGLYLLFGLVAWVFIQAVFFTVQLM